MSSGDVSEKPAVVTPNSHRPDGKRPWEEGKNLYEVSLRANPKRMIRADDREQAIKHYKGMLGIRGSEHEFMVDGPIKEESEEQPVAEPKAEPSKPAASTMETKQPDNSMLSGQRKK